MTDEVEQIGPGVRRQLASSSPKFEPFTSISGASSKVLAALSREDDSYKSIPMASISFKGEDGYQSHSFTLAVDDLAFVNLVLSSSLREIVIAYDDGAIHHMHEPDEVSKRLISLVDHWEALGPVLRGFAIKLIQTEPQPSPE